MPEEIMTAQTTVETDADSHADIDNKQDVVNDAEFTDTPEKVEEVKPAQDNAENARRRREAERQKELKQAREQAIIETLGGKNPFTNEEMKDSKDVQEFLLMKEIEKAGGDPVADYSKYQKTKAREDEKKQAEVDAKNEWYKKDREDFVAKHPEADLDTLVKNEQFKLFANGKVGVMPMSKIYEDFLAFSGGFEKQVNSKAVHMTANKKATPGSLSHPNAPDNSFFTQDQVKNMSQAEVDKNYEKIRESMKRWK